MPKKNGITKTFSFDAEVVQKLNDLCKVEHRTQTNLLESLILEKYEKEVGNGKTKETN